MRKKHPLRHKTKTKKNEAKQSDDKVQQMVNRWVDPYLKLRLGGGAKDSKGMSL